MDELWYAIHLRGRHERLIASILANKGYETFLPVYRSLRRTAANKPGQERVLFPGYVFCRFDARRRLPILVTPGVIQIVGVGKTPVPVDERELEDIRRVVTSLAAASPAAYLEVGQKVRLDSGPLAGMEGILTEVKNSMRLVVCVSVLRRSIAVEIDAGWIQAADSVPRVFLKRGWSAAPCAAQAAGAPW